MKDIVKIRDRERKRNVTIDRKSKKESWITKFRSEVDYAISFWVF